MTGAGLLGARKRNGRDAWGKEHRGLSDVKLFPIGTAYLPPYSPDFNQIELAFSKFKWLLKSSAARTVEGLWQKCGELLNAFTESECRNCFRHCG